VDQLGLPWRTALGLEADGDWLSNSDFSAEEVNLVIRVDLVVVLRVLKGEGKHTLLLQVGLVL